MRDKSMSFITVWGVQTEKRGQTERGRSAGSKTDRDTGDIILLLLSWTWRENQSFLCCLKSTIWQVNPGEYIKGGLIPTQINIYREEHDCWKCNLKTKVRGNLSDRLAPASTDASEVVLDELSCFSWLFKVWCGDPLWPLSRRGFAQVAQVAQVTHLHLSKPGQTRTT